MSDRITFAGKIESEGRRLRGSVTLTGSRTFRDGEWVQVDPKALLKADASNVFATLDHDMTKVVGRTRNDTLSLNRTEDGISFETADLPNVAYANDGLELAKGGYFGGASFTVEGIRSKFTTDPADGLRVRTINSIKRLVDVAIVMDPAFSQSTAAAFGKESPMTDEPTPEPQPEPEPPAARFTDKPLEGAAYWTKFASTLSTEQVEAQMDALFQSAKGNLTGDSLARYEGFASELQSRKMKDAETKMRVERMEVEHNLRLGRTVKAPGNSELFASDDYTEAFSQYLRTGNARLMEQFAQSVAGTGAEGGYTVPDGFLQRVTERLLSYGGIASVADTITTANGESLRWPSNDDTSNSAAIAAEGAAGAAGADLVFGNITLGAWSYDANGTTNVPLKVSLELLQDSAFDIAAFVGRKLGERLGRKMAADLANGAGTTEPVGLLTKTPDTMTASVCSLAAPEHIFQVDAAYRDQGNCRFIMSDATLVKFWQSQTTANQPLFQPNGVSIGGSPSGTIYGFPVQIEPAAANLVAFGDFRLGYIVRRVRGVQLLVDPYTLSGVRQVAYHAWARMDANIQDAYAYSVSDYAGVSADT